MWLFSEHSTSVKVKRWQIIGAPVYENKPKSNKQGLYSVQQDEDLEWYGIYVFTA